MEAQYDLQLLLAIIGQRDYEIAQLQKQVHELTRQLDTLKAETEKPDGHAHH